MRRWGRWRREGLEALFRERAAGVGFEIFLEGQRFVFVREGAVPDKLPRFEFGCVGGSARVMIWYPPFQVGGRTDVLLVGKIDAADDVDVSHRVSAPCEGKTTSRLLCGYGVWPASARLRPSGYAGHHASSFGQLVAAPRVARRAKRGGARRDRTADLLHAMQALSQLSYGPI
jgi:hypothetical protein